MTRKLPPQKGVQSISSLTAELAASDEGQALPQRQKGRLMFLSFNRLRQFRGHPFRLYTGERLADIGGEHPSKWDTHAPHSSPTVAKLLEKLKKSPHIA